MRRLAAPQPPPHDQWINATPTMSGNPRVFRSVVLLRILTALPLFGPPAGAQESRKPSGPLTVHPKNTRHFTYGSGKAIYQTGSHTWSSLQDMGYTDPPPTFDFDGHLDLLANHHHDFISLGLGGPTVTTAVPR
jgi:hypothetical protein